MDESWVTNPSCGFFSVKPLVELFHKKGDKYELINIILRVISSNLFEQKLDQIVTFNKHCRLKKSCLCSVTCSPKTNDAGDHWYFPFLVFSFVYLPRFQTKKYIQSNPCKTIKFSHSTNSLKILMA